MRSITAVISTRSEKYACSKCADFSLFCLKKIGKVVDGAGCTQKTRMVYSFRASGVHHSRALIAMLRNSLYLVKNILDVLAFKTMD